MGDRNSNNSLEGDMIKVFADESEELIQELEKNILLIERTDDDTEVLEIVQSIFRVIHTLKSSSAFMGYKNIS
ncbi:MAG: Hpt domain-containing protein, partial [Candidatus Hodarchaeales archaeon]